MMMETQLTKNNWKLFTLKNDNNMSVRFLNFGGIITEINVPDRNQNIQNVVLRYKRYKDYEQNTNYLGALLGRMAGRIQHSSFTLDNKIYDLEKNSGFHHLHGGSSGFHQVIWESKPFQTDNTIGVQLTYQSRDGDGGYPGNIKTIVTYSLNNRNQFRIDYMANSDNTTVFTMTNHSYFNLSGNLASTIQNHLVTIDSDEFVELDEDLIPTGKKTQVTGTTFDFRNNRKLADGLNSTFSQNKVANSGYDHYFIFNQKKHENICVIEKTSGRKMTIKTNQPGVVMYTGNSLSEDLDLAKGKSKRYLGVCFETQASPASLHHEGFPTVILKANETYQKHTVFTFGLAE